MMTPRQGQCTRKVGGAEPAAAGHGVRGRNRRTRFAGICEAAQALGVTRQHLYFVLVGERRSPRIEASETYLKLIGRGGSEA